MRSWELDPYYNDKRSTQYNLFAGRVQVFRTQIKLASQGTMDRPSHPFYPVEVKYIGYLANDRSVLELLGIFALGCIAIVSLTIATVNRYNPRLHATDKASVVWFVFSRSLCVTIMLPRPLTFGQLAQSISSLKVSPTTRITKSVAK